MNDESEPASHNRRDDFDAWLRLVARFIAFALGCVFVTYGLLFVDDLSAKALPVGVGLGFAWPIVGPGVQSAFAAMRGGRRDGNGTHNETRNGSE